MDIEKLALWLVPPFLRQPKMIAWVRSLVRPLETVHRFFTEKQTQDRYKLSHNGQICFLRKALNDAFDPELRRIVLAEGNQFQATYIYTEGEQKTKFLGTIFLQSEADLSDTGVDFIVKLPQEVYQLHKQEPYGTQPRFYEIESLIDFYKLASKRYKIING